jgi:hypothetical protein
MAAAAVGAIVVGPRLIRIEGHSMVGLPGEELTIAAGVVRISGQPLAEPI